MTVDAGQEPTKVVDGLSLQALENTTTPLMGRLYWTSLEKDFLDPQDVVVGGDIFALETRRVLRMGVDSGAAITVMPKDQCVDYPLVETKESRANVHYRAANGSLVKDLGCRTVATRTEKGDVRYIRARAADVVKPLLSVAEMVDAGHTVVFSKDRSYAKHMESGREIDFARRQGVFEVDFEVLPGPFGRQARP